MCDLCREPACYRDPKMSCPLLSASCSLNGLPPPRIPSYLPLIARSLLLSRFATSFFVALPLHARKAHDLGGLTCTG